MAGARSLSSLFQTVYKSNVSTLNAALEPECQYITLPDGSVVQKDPAACLAKTQAKTVAAHDNIIDKYVVPVVQGIAGFVPVIGTASSIALKLANTIQTAGAGQPLIAGPGTSLTPTRGGNMGLFDDIWGSATGPGGIFNSNSGINWTGLLNTGVGIAQQAFAPQPSAAPMPSGGGVAAIPAMASVPAIAGRVGAVVGRNFFSRFPNLATSIQGLRNAGQNVTRAKLYGVMKRFGPEFLVSGGLLTAAAVNELAVAGPGRRRMNPANSKALRRAARRIESFHRLCQTTDRLRPHRRKSR